MHKSLSILTRFSTRRFLTILGGLAFGLHGWFIVLLLPRTLLRLLNVFRPGGHGIANDDFWAFGRRDARFRAYYNKIARDYHTQGRFGYAWDDGLGMPLGERIYSNWGTYLVLYHLGTRNTVLIGYLAMLIATGYLGVWAWGLGFGLIITVIAAGSPLLVASYTHLSKPELVWWGLGLFFVWLGLQDFPIAAGLLWTLIAFVNLPVSVMLILMAGPAIILTGIWSGTWYLFIALVLPGMLKHGVRTLHMLRSGQLSSLVSEQAGLWKRRFMFLPGELLVIVPVSLALLISGYFNDRLLIGLALLAPCIILYWANWRLIYLNDPQSFHLALWAIGIAFAVVSGSWPGVLLIIIMAYNQPILFGVHSSRRSLHTGDSEDMLQRVLARAVHTLRHYPDLQPMRLPQPPKLMAFFAEIPVGSRVLFESRTYIRTDPQFKGFVSWMEDFLPLRMVDLLNEEYTRIAEPELDKRYISSFNVDHFTPSEMLTICQSLGISYVIAYSPEMLDALLTVGYQPVARVDLADDWEIRSLFSVPPVVLVLLACPACDGLISPPVDWKRDRNELRWNAIAGEIYLIRHRYHRNFECHQDGEQLAVEGWHPFEGVPTRFMKIATANDGWVTLKYKTNWQL